MWPSSLTCYLQWLNKCVFVMAKKSPYEPQTACINSILPGTITNASELFCIRRKDNAKHFWKHCHPSNSQHIPLQHTCRRKKPQNISEHSYPYCSPCLTAMAPHHGHALLPALWPTLWSQTLAPHNAWMWLANIDDSGFWYPLDASAWYRLPLRHTGSYYCHISWFVRHWIYILATNGKFICSQA